MWTYSSLGMRAYLNKVQNLVWIRVRIRIIAILRLISLWFYVVLYPSYEALESFLKCLVNFFGHSHSLVGYRVAERSSLVQLQMFHGLKFVGLCFVTSTPGFVSLVLLTVWLGFSLHCMLKQRLVTLIPQRISLYPPYLFFIESLIFFFWWNNKISSGVFFQLFYLVIISYQNSSYYSFNICNMGMQ